jgi:hypothetical protein
MMDLFIFKPQLRSDFLTIFGFFHSHIDDALNPGVCRVLELLLLTSIPRSQTLCMDVDGRISPTWEEVHEFAMVSGPAPASLTSMHPLPHSKVGFFFVSSHLEG